MKRKWGHLVACVDCGKPHRVEYGKEYQRCQSCNGKARMLPLLPPDYIPIPNEIRRGSELGYKCSTPRIWAACSICGKYRWTFAIKRQAVSKICHKCNSLRGLRIINAKHDKNRVLKTTSGYVLCRRSEHDKFWEPMAHKYGHILEHRLVMAKHLGRCLASFESVHHKNGIKDDNRIENLELTTNGAHSKRHSKGYRDGYQQGYYDAQCAYDNELKQEILLLKLEISCLKDTEGAVL